MLSVVVRTQWIMVVAVLLVLEQWKLVLGLVSWSDADAAVGAGGGAAAGDVAVCVAAAG